MIRCFLIYTKDIKIIITFFLIFDLHYCNAQSLRKRLIGFFSAGYTQSLKHSNKKKMSNRSAAYFLGEMQVHEYFTDLFEEDQVDTEAFVYSSLKEKPLNMPVNYLAVPWAVLIRLNMLDKLPKLKKLNGGFTVCQHIRPWLILPLLEECGIDVLFTPHAKVGETYNNIKLIPIAHRAVNGVDPAETKDILYSFIGFNQGYDKDQLRKQIFQMPVLEGCVIKERQFWHFSRDSFSWVFDKKFSKEQQEAEKKEYKDVLSRSRFSLCPKGTGLSSLRFWESLQAGAIPVLIADNLALPIEDMINWDECIVRIAEKDVSKINEIILSISPEQEEKKRHNCFRAYELCSGENFVLAIRRYYEQIVKKPK